MGAATYPKCDPPEGDAKSGCRMVGSHGGRGIVKEAVSAWNVQGCSHVDPKLKPQLWTPFSRKARGGKKEVKDRPEDLSHFWLGEERGAKKSTWENVEECRGKKKGS